MLQLIMLVLTLLIPSQNDCSQFIDDVTFPDGSAVRAGSVVIKKWELRNCGTVTWTNRSVRRLEKHNDKDSIQSEAQTKIPDTKPGESCIIEVKITIPQQRGTYKANWKMIDATGREIFPNKMPIYVIINAT